MTFLNKLFNEKYFRIKQFEKDGKVYEIIGIKAYKKNILHLTMGKKLSNYNLTNYSIEGLKDFEKITRYNEKYHFIAFFPTLLFTLALCYFSGYIGRTFYILLSILVNIYGNFYPICLQRYNRIRINKILCKLESHK